MAKFCEYCGAPLEEDSRFCTSCGHPVARQSQPTQQPRPSQQAQQPRPQQQPRGGQQQTSQQGYQYRQSSNSVNFQPSPQAYRPQPPKKKGGFLKVLLIVALIAVLGYGAEEYYQYRHAKKVYEELTKDYPEKMEKLRQRKQVAAEPELGNGETADSETLDDIDWSSIIKLTDEEREYLKNHPVVATPENSPGNPAFIKVTYSEEEYANAPTYAALVTQENPEVDFPELGIHVNMKSWNLEFEQDSLIVKQLPDKVDETTGKILHSYDYSLVSKQHNFLTGVEFTAPVQGDPDAFTGFVTYNEATGRWEDVYCELSEDRRTFTAHLSHFSNGSALETIKTEGSAAIEKYTINGNSIFVQLPTEMQPKYDESEHYLYPVAVAEETDLEFFFNKQQKNKTFINRYLLGKDNVPEKDVLQIVSDWFGVAGTSGDVVSNATLFENENGVLGKWSSSCFIIGYTALALDIANQLADNKDTLDVLDEKKEAIANTLLGFIGTLASCAATETVLFAAVGGGIAAGTLGTAVSVISAIIFASTANDNIIKPIDGWVKKQIIDLKYPLGAPTSIAEAALQLYMQDYAHSDRGYYSNKVSAWDWAWGRQESPEIDSAKVYALTPQKILDHNPKNWLVAYDCLVKHHVGNPKKMFQAYDNMFKNYVDAFWEESTEIKKKYIRMACRKYIEVDMRYYLHNQGGTTQEPAMTVAGAEVFHMPKLDTSVYKFTPKAESEWKEIQQDFINHATRLKKQEKDSRPNDYRMAGKGSDVTEIEVWDAVFKEWDAAGVDNKELRYLGNPKEQKAFFHDKYIALFRYRLTPLLKDYYKKQYHNSIGEIRKLLNNQVLPVLNTRLTFYANKLSDTDDDIIKDFETDKVRQPIEYFYDSLPDFAFILCDKKPKFKPGNYGEVKPGFPLKLKPNKKNAVLLETTAYHYLMYDCPLEVEIKPKDGSKPLKGNANWDGVKLVQDWVESEKKARERANDYGVGTLRISNDPTKDLQNDIADTRIPIEFRKKAEKKKPVESTKPSLSGTLRFVPVNYGGDGVYDEEKDVFRIPYKVGCRCTWLHGAGYADKNHDFNYSGTLNRSFDRQREIGPNTIESYHHTGTISANVEITGSFDTVTWKGTCKFTASGSYSGRVECHPIGRYNDGSREATICDKNFKWSYSGEGVVTVSHYYKKNDTVELHCTIEKENVRGDVQGTTHEKFYDGRTGKLKRDCKPKEYDGNGNRIFSVDFQVIPEDKYKLK